MTRRPLVIHDNAYPLGGSRDRRRGAFDNDPSETRPRLEAHLKRSMGAQNYATAISLLDAYINSWLGLSGGEEEGESESGAVMDARLDHGASSLAEMFPDAKAPMRVLVGVGEGESNTMDSRVLDQRPGQLATLFADAPNPSARTYR